MQNKIIQNNELTLVKSILGAESSSHQRNHRNLDVINITVQKDYILLRKF